MQFIAEVTYVNLATIEQKLMLESFFYAYKVIDIWKTLDKRFVACTTIN